MTEEKQDIQNVFSKLEDLKNVFKFAESIVPIIQSLIEFMQEMTPLLETINTSISESTSQMQKGTDRISDVTNATELATTEILDLVDEISDQVLNFQNRLTEAVEKRAKSEKLLSEIESKIDDKETLDLLNQLKANISSSIDYEKEIETLKGIHENSYKITLALQVQDITAQQLASVNHLISSVHNRLTSLISEIDENEFKQKEMELNEATKTFDDNASFTKESNQNQVDEIFNTKKEENKSGGGEQLSSDEIDKLFS